MQRSIPATRCQGRSTSGCCAQHSRKFRHYPSAAPTRVDSGFHSARRTRRCSETLHLWTKRHTLERNTTPLVGWGVALRAAGVALDVWMWAPRKHRPESATAIWAAVFPHREACDANCVNAESNRTMGRSIPRNWAPKSFWLTFVYWNVFCTHSSGERTGWPPAL